MAPRTLLRAKMTRGDSTCAYQFDPTDPATWPPGVEPGRDAKDEEFHRCGHETESDRDRCWLHTPIASRPDDFDEQAAVAARIQDEADITKMTPGDGGTVGLVGVRLREVDWSAIVDAIERAAQTDGADSPFERVHTLDFRYSSVDETVSVGNFEVEQQLDLRGAAIGRFEARNAEFREEVDLQRGQIGDEENREPVESPGKLDCSEATFAEAFRLDDTRVYGSLGLGHVESVRELQAKDLRVHGTLSLDGLLVEDSTVLAEVDCRSISAHNADLAGVEAQGLTVDGDASFDDVEFHLDEDDGATVKMPNVAVGGDLSFNGATFYHQAKLNGTSIGGELDLEDATFEAGLNLNEAEVGGPVAGAEVIVEESLECEGAQFREVVTLSRGEFGGPAIFERSTFEKQAQFDRARFVRAATFDGAVFATDCDFRTTTGISDGGQGGTIEPVPAGDRTTPESSEGVRGEAGIERATDGGSVVQSRPRGVFHSDASFVGTVVRGIADFRIFDRSNGRDRNELFAPDAEVITGGLTVRGEFDATGARLTNANLSGFRASGEITLNEADLSGTNLRDADLRGAEAERARFSNTNLFGTDLRDTYLHGTVFEGTRIDDQTQFSDRVRYHREAASSTDAEDEEEALSKAISLYSQLETLARDNGRSDLARTVYVSRKEADRRQLRLKGDVRWLAASTKRLIMNYGESYYRVLGTSVGLIAICAVLFVPTDLTSAGGTQVAFHGLSVETLEAFALAFLFSVSSFTALGSSGFETGPWAGLLAVTEAGLGIIMFGVLLFVLQRRTAR